MPSLESIKVQIKELERVLTTPEIQADAGAQKLVEAHLADLKKEAGE